MIGLYIGKTGVVSGFGGGSSVIKLGVMGLLLGADFSLGAQFTWLYAQRFGSRKNTNETET